MEWFHVETVSRTTGITLFLVPGKDKQQARREAYRMINRNGLNRFVKDVLTQQEYENKYGKPEPFPDPYP